MSKLILPPGYTVPAASGDKYMPHLRHIYEYLQQQGELDDEERVAITMVACVAAVKTLATDVTRKVPVIASAVKEFRVKLVRYL